MKILLFVISLFLCFSARAMTPDMGDQERQVNALVTSLLKYTEVKLETLVMEKMECQVDPAFCNKVAVRIRKKIEDSGKWTFITNPNRANAVLKCGIRQAGVHMVLQGHLLTKAGKTVWEDNVTLTRPATVIIPTPPTPTVETRKEVAKFLKKKAGQRKAKSRKKTRKKAPVNEAAVQGNKETDAAGVLGEAFSSRTAGKAGMGRSTLAIGLKVPGVAVAAIGETVAFDSSRVPASRWKTFWAAFTPVHLGPRGGLFDIGLAYKHYIPRNETFYKGAGEANGMAAQVSWADCANVEFDYWARDGLAINQVKNLTGLGISPTLALPIQFGDHLVVYAGGGGRFESVAVAANHIPEGAITYGNNSVLITVGTKVKFWNLGLDANWAYDFWATHSPSSMLRLGLFYQVK